MIPNEMDRLAHAVNALRPDWPVGSLRTFIAIHLSAKTYRDATLAFAWIAVDPTTRTPARINESGPWWGVANDAPETDRSITAYRGPRCRVCGRDRAGHDSAESKVPPEARHEWTETDPPRATPDRVAAIRARQAQMQERQL